MASNAIKQIDIDNGSGGFNSKPVGADANNIDVYYDANGKIVEESTSITKNLAKSLGEIDDKISGHIVDVNNNLVGDAEAEKSDEEAKGPHVGGSYFLCDGQLARADENIVQGDSLTNKYTSTYVGEELKLTRDAISVMEGSKADLSFLALFYYNPSTKVLTITGNGQDVPNT